MSKHTKGPWRIQVLGNQKADLISGGTFMGLTGGSGAPDVYDPDDAAEWEANGRLITAAPDLLEALKKLLRDEAVLDDDDPQLGASRVQARAAITKAEGLDAERGTGASGSEPAKCS